MIAHNTTDLLPQVFQGPLHPLVYLVHPGWIGVQLFFALSGFLITAGLLDSRGADNYFRGFFARRALRILPLYYSVLFTVLVVLPRLVPLPQVTGATFEDRASLWLFVMNWTDAGVYGFGHFWSLAVEEQFYLCWPLLVFFLPARPLLPACLGIALGAVVIRSIMAMHGAEPWTIYSSTVCRVDALALGGAGACILRMPPYLRQLRGHLTAVVWGTLGLFAIGIGATHGYDTDRFITQTGGYTILAICCAVFVTAVAMLHGTERIWVTAALGWKPLQSCGKYSYGMYVFHQIIHKLAGDPWMHSVFGPHPPAWSVFTYSAVIALVSFGLAFASYRGLERHFLRLKRYFRPRAVPGAPSAPLSA